MRKLIYSMMTALDGFIEGPDRALDWPIIDEELHVFINQLVENVGAFVYRWVISHGKRQRTQQRIAVNLPIG
jgi:dihydrofolate reductase